MKLVTTLPYTMDGDPYPIGQEYPLGETLKSLRLFSFLTTCPSPKTTLTLPSHLGQNVALGRDRWAVSRKP